MQHTEEQLAHKKTRKLPTIIKEGIKKSQIFGTLGTHGWGGVHYFVKKFTYLENQ